MSIFFEFDVGSNGRRLRRAIDDDKSDIELLLGQERGLLFDDVDIGSLIELSTLSLCMIDDTMQVVGFIALCDHPNIPAVDPAAWENWIRNMYQKFYLSRNTLFIHFMCCSTECEDVFLEEALLSAFKNDPYLYRIVIIVPLTCPPDQLTKHKIFKRGVALKVPAKLIEKDSGVLPYLYEFMREKIFPKLKIRRAVQEDNDDVVEILDRLSPQLKEQYGNFYISEIVGFHPESQRKILVAEHREKAVGVMCLNSEINYTMLHNTYELRAFHGLTKVSHLEQEKAKRANFLMQQFGEPIMRGSISPFTNISEAAEEKVSTQFCFRQRKSKKRVCKRKSKSKVIFHDKVKMRKVAESEIRGNKDSDSYNRRLDNQSSHFSFYDVKEYLDDDPFDYEIVNIDMDLLQLPEMFSSIDINRDWNDPKTKEKCKRRLSKRISETDRHRKLRASLHLHGIAQEATSQPKEDESYRGELNAFIIELFGLEDDLHECHGFEFLEAAFEIMSSCDYCLIRVPPTEYNSLLQHFTYVPQKPQTCTEYALYVAHKNSVLGRLRVRRAEFVDIPLITQLLQHKEEHKILCAVQCDIQNDSNFQSFVLYCGLNLVGLAVLHETEHIEFTRASYNFDPYHNHKYHRRGQDLLEGFTTLQSMVVFSAFQPHFRFFAREVLRFSGCNSLLWLAARRVKLGLGRFNNIAEEMIPLMPRNCCSNFEEIVELRKLNNISKNTAPFMVWFLNKKMTSFAKVTVDTRIVVIGASRTALAFLNTLLFSDSCSYLTFNSVSLVSPHGLPFAKKSHPHAEMMFTKFSNTTEFNLKCVPYQYYVNVIEETMVDIDKKDKCITFSNGSKYYYDLLFLLFGKQYQHPDYMKPVGEQAKDSRITKLLPHLPLDLQKYLEKQPYSISNKTPANVFIVNDIHDANKALWHINCLYWNNPYFKILVYGASIHAYCCLATLLSMGVLPETIEFVEPFPPEDPKKTRIPIFSNVYVNRSVKEILNDYGITVYKGYYFQNWTLDPQSNLASHVEFLSHFHMIKLECSAFFYYGRREVNEEAFIAINKSGLAYNAGILIDHEFRTKDPSILAAGPCTRYYSRYFAEDKRQKYYDSYEIGEKLGTHVRNQLDPIFSPKNMKSKRQTVSFAKKKSSTTFVGDVKNQTEALLDGIQKWRESRDKSPEWKLPDLRMPLVTHCTLPGGLQYLDVRSPGLKTPHPYLQSLTHNGMVMETLKQGYFKLHCTNDCTVDGVTCLTPSKQSIEKFKNLYGFSSAVLNHVCLKFATNKIEDFFEFFNMPWAQFLYYEHVYELLAMVQELYPQVIENRQTLREGLIAKSDELGAEASAFRTSMCTDLRSNFDKSPYIEAITNYVLEWLSENEILLPLYFQKWHNAEFQVGTENIEAFKIPTKKKL